MIARAGVSWQTLLADLSLILFMITSAALSQAEDGGARETKASPQAEPLSVYRTGKDAPPLGQWLAAQPRDPRQLLTIVSTYRRGGQPEALDTAEMLARQAGEMGTTARIVVEPGEGGASATLAYDRPAVALAQSLQGSVRTLPADPKGP